MAPIITRQHWEQLEPLLDAALDAEPADRASVLASVGPAAAEFSSDDLAVLAAACERPDPFLDAGALERFPLLLEEMQPQPAPPDGLAAALTGRYRIGGVLGEGGMATVYLARDIRHNRDVAIKVLRPEIAAVLGSERFLHEIEVTAKLEHPYILPLLDSGEANGLLYYVMPYVRGETLRERLRRETWLPVADAVEIAREVADALVYAARNGVVHRDIKPENILLASDHVRVADFGIARALTSAGAASFTTMGVALGTPAYMSPEQVGGSENLDGRSDIYSLACVLYEMLGGEPPFTGESSASVARQHVTADPAPLRSVRTEVPFAVERAIQTALAKRPEDRFANAAEFATALDTEVGEEGAAGERRSRRLVTFSVGIGALVLLAGVLTWNPSPEAASTSLDANAIAVLPFRVTAADSSYNYLREGVVDLLNAQLTGDGVPRAVDSRTTLSAWRRATASAGGELTADQSLALARSLGAGRLLLGELVVTPGRRNVSGRIVRVPEGQIIAEHTEAGNMDELLLVHRLVGRLLARSAGEADARIPTLSDSITALKEYLAGVGAFRRGENAAADQHLMRALEIDSLFAMAALWRALADHGSAAEIEERTQRAWNLRHLLGERDRALLFGHFGIGPNYPQTSSMAELLRASERAAQLNPDRAEVWYDFGSYMFVHGPQVRADWRDRAVAALDSAIALDPTSALAVRWRFETALAGGQRDEIERYARLNAIVNVAGDFIVRERWLAAHALGDRAALRMLNGSLMNESERVLFLIDDESALHGFPLANAEEIILHRLSSGSVADAAREQHAVALFHMAALRGRVGDALARTAQLPLTRLLLPITAALAEPVFAASGRFAADAIDAVADTASHAGLICYRQLWRVAHGDTSETREDMARIRHLVRDLPPAGYPRVGRFDVCPVLLGAMLERMQATRDATPMVDSLAALVREGPGLELPGNLATLMLARWRAADGDHQEALAVVRARPLIHEPNFTLVLPAHLREEGRLAALVGDTAGARRAYQHYLTLRDQPDPGAMQEEVRQLRAEQAKLSRGSRTRRSR